jgi:hypothetical protein
MGGNNGIPSDVKDFYSRALSKAERVRLAKARQVEGIDQEIALLRLKLRQLVEKHPDKLDLLFKGVNLLLRAVATRYRLSPRAEDDLSKSITGVLQGVGHALGLEEGNGRKGA